VERCLFCGSKDIIPSYDWVPYGSTDVQMQTGWECEHCRDNEYDYITVKDRAGKPFYVGFQSELGAMGQIIGFYWKPEDVGKPNLYSYYTFTLLERDPDVGLWLDGSYPDRVIDWKDMDRVIEFIKEFGE
jgi:hypothetical protein